MSTPIRPPYWLEVPIFDPFDVLPAISAGAGRIELNAHGSYAAGGTTPSAAEVTAAIAVIDENDSSKSVPLRVMIRPRGGDFVYTEAEIAEMVGSIARYTSLLRLRTWDGFVFGVLKVGKDGRMEVDEVMSARLIQAAGGFPCVFHRAFDVLIGKHEVKDLETEVENSKDEKSWVKHLRALELLGFDGVLTSGGIGNAPDEANMTMLQNVVEFAFDGGAWNLWLDIVVGGGVRSTNVRRLASRLNTVALGRICYHSSCITGRLDSEYAAEVGMGTRVDEEEVRAISAILIEETTD